MWRTRFCTSVGRAASIRPLQTETTIRCIFCELRPEKLSTEKPQRITSWGLITLSRLHFRLGHASISLLDFLFEPRDDNIYFAPKRFLNINLIEENFSVVENVYFLILRLV